MALYSIGTSNRSWDAFLKPLVELDIRALFDVRSRPFSRFSHFNRPKMEAALGSVGIRYEWRGDVLGGLEDVDKEAPRFKAALIDILAATSDGPTAYFCSEGEPASCHRAWTVGAEILRQHHVSTLNILRDDTLEPIEATLARIPKNVSGIS